MTCDTTRLWDVVRDCRANTPAWVWPGVDLVGLPDPPAVEPRVVPPPGRYRLLHEWFSKQSDDRIELSDEALDELITGGRPPGATSGVCRREWWTNNPRKAHSRAWVNAGYAVTGDTTEDGKRVFVRRTYPRLTRAEVVRLRVGALFHVSNCPTSSHDSHPVNGPAGVYIAHSATDRLFKVGVATRPHERVKAQNSVNGAVEILQVINVRHRACALAVEAVVLNLTEPWRVIGDPWHAGGGRTEMWSERGPLPNLVDIAHRINPGIG